MINKPRLVKSTAWLWYVCAFPAPKFKEAYVGHPSKVKRIYL